MSNATQNDNVKMHLEKMLELMGIKATVNQEAVDEATTCYRIDCAENDAGMLIGKRGQTLEAVQFLLRQMSRTTQSEDEYFIVDVCDYRSRRKEAVVERAKRGAVAVLNGEFEVYDLPPMSAYERRIVHNYLQENFPDLASSSYGQGEDRHIVIQYGGEGQAENQEPQEKS